MNPTAQETELRSALRPWLDRADSLVDRRLADARLHAAAGGLSTAGARLGELRRSLTQHISDARASFYRQSFQQHTRAGLDPDVHQVGTGPTTEGEAAARAAEILGRNYFLEVADIVEDAKASLQSATLAGGMTHLDNWSEENRGRLVSRVQSELSTSQIAIYEAVGQILIKPELR